MAAAASALDASVLVLNKLYLPIHIVSARRAFGLLCRAVAEVVTFEDDRFETHDFESWCELSGTIASRPTTSSPGVNFRPSAASFPTTTTTTSEP